MLDFDTLFERIKLVIESASFDKKNRIINLNDEYSTQILEYPDNYKIIDNRGTDVVVLNTMKIVDHLNLNIPFLDLNDISPVSLGNKLDKGSSFCFYGLLFRPNGTVETFYSDNDLKIFEDKTFKRQAKLIEILNGYLDYNDNIRRKDNE